MNELWHLTEAECEELRVLQTITPFVSTELLVTDWALAKVYQFRSINLETIQLVCFRFPFSSLLSLNFPTKAFQSVTKHSLLKSFQCIVIAIKLNFSKDPSVINAASAAVRQSCRFVFFIIQIHIQTFWN